MDITIPAVGESITEGVLSRWLVENGGFATEGEPLYELETDKISSEIVADASGVVTHGAEEGETLEVGAVIGSIDTEANAPAAAEPASTIDVGASDHSPEDAQSSDSITTSFNVSDVAPDQLSPAVAALVNKHKLNAADIKGTGPGGRISKADVLAFVDKQSASPAPATSTTAPAPTPASTPTPVSSGSTRKKMSPLRKRIAQRLVNAQQTAAILTTFNEIDMSFVMKLRKRFKDDFAEKHQTGLGFMSFFTKATCLALQDFPLINSAIDGEEIVSPDGIHMGIAVGTEKGLVVPVLRDCQDMGFADIEQGIRGFAKKARDGKLSLADMEGGSFTITNGGVYGSLLSTPIINPPQSGILGMHGIQERPIAVNGEVVIRPMMYIALSYDHRIVDGKEAVGFLVRIKELIEAPERMIFGL